MIDREIEAKAWNGTLDFDKFPAAEYKFCDTVQLIGIRYRLEHYPLDFCKQDIERARKEYEKEREKIALGAEMYRQYHEALMKSSELRCQINKAETVSDKLSLALECIELLTGEEGFARRAYDDSKRIS